MYCFKKRLTNLLLMAKIVGVLQLQSRDHLGPLWQTNWQDGYLCDMALVT